MADRPNLVFLLNDHQAYYRHGWDGGPRVQRPHFDRLARGGVVFDRAYSATPLCGPARRTMLTGLFAHNHGETHNDTNHPYDREVYLDLLAEAGYRSHYFGKWHAGPGTAHDHGCEGLSHPSYNNPYTKPEYADYLKRYGLPEPEVLVERSVSGWQDIPVGPGYRQRNRWCNEHAHGILTTPTDTHEAFYLANLARDQLRELAASDDGRPFALRVDFWGPHQPYFPTREFADLYDPASIPEYGNFADTREGKRAIYRHEGNVPLHEDYRLIQPSPLPWSEWQTMLARSYAQTTLVDAAGGRILDALDELGMADNTLVLWTTDHGDALACHGGHYDKSAYMPEEMIRIPMALRCPGRVEPGRSSDALVSLIDVAPTLLDGAGLAFDGDVDGASLLGLCDGAEWRDDLMCETFGHQFEHVGRALLTDRYKYVYNQDDLDELYDLEADPYELANLATDPAHGTTLADLRTRLDAWVRRTGA